MTKAPAFPSPIFIAWGHHGRLGWNIIGDWCADLDGAMDYVCEAHEHRADAPGFWRITSYSIDPDTGLPERPEDMTSRAVAERTEWLTKNGMTVPGWLSGEDDWDEDGCRADAAWHERMGAAE